MKSWLTWIVTTLFDSARTPEASANRPATMTNVPNKNFFIILLVQSVIAIFRLTLDRFRPLLFSDQTEISRPQAHLSGSLVFCSVNFSRYLLAETVLGV